MLVGVELPLCIVVTYSILQCYNLFSGVKLSVRSFCFTSQCIMQIKLKMLTTAIDYSAIDGVSEEI